MTDKVFNIPANASPGLKQAWAQMPEQYKLLERMKFDQAMRGYEGYQKRMAHRAATHKTWVQMKGFQRVWYELSYPTHWPFALGFLITSSGFYYLYFTNLTDETKAASDYWQRFHAKKEDKHH